LSTRMEKTKPLMRKQPAQGRSKATVDAIIEAAARILSDHGWSALTTNKVAEIAGVSIGSYYQYFPDKHALVEAIRDRHLEDCRAVLKHVLSGDYTFSECVEQLADGVIATHSVHPGLHRVLLDEVPTSEAFRDLNSAFEKEYLGYYCAVVAKYGLCQNELTNHTVGTTLSDAIDGVVHNAARRGTLQTRDVRNELARMIKAYLSAT
jgi:AcrR family transcriptional regulator